MKLHLDGQTRGGLMMQNNHFSKQQFDDNDSLTILG